jgi:hypothetical protein
MLWLGSPPKNCRFLAITCNLAKLHNTSANRKRYLFPSEVNEKNRERDGIWNMVGIEGFVVPSNRRGCG